MATPSPPRRMGRRRRRLYWTVALLVLAAVGGSAVGVSLLRAGRTEGYVPGEDSDAITRRLDLGIPDAAPTPAFVDVTEAAGLGAFRSFAGARTSQLPEDMGAGAAWGDVDGDGDDDLFAVAAGGPLDADPATWARSRLYLNQGDGTFVEDATFPELRIVGMGAAFGDRDGDGDLDLVVTGWNALRLFRNDAGRFVTDPTLETRPGFWAGASWADFDRDGDLDLYVCGYVRYVEDAGGTRRATPMYGRAVPYTLNPATFEPERNLLFRNDGAAFTEVAVALGVDNPAGRSLGALWHDLDADGWPDLYVANDISDNALLLNPGKPGGRFEDASHEAWVADYRGAMGLAVGDWNRDGDDDLFVTHWVAQENALYDSLLNDLAAAGNDGERVAGLRFVDVADRQGLGQIALRRVGWGTEFVDLDADGWLDLVVANGSTLEDDAQPPELKAEPAFVFWNNRGAGFHDLAPLDAALAAPRVSRGLAVGDYDLDGDVDLLFVDRDGGLRLFENRVPQGHWVGLRLSTPSRRAPRPVVDGARVTVVADGVRQRRALVSASYLSQSSRTLHVGLGAAERVEAVTVTWPDGAVERWTDLSADRVWEIRRGEATAVAVAPRVPAPAPSVERAATRPDAASPDAERARVVAFWQAQRAAMHAMKVERDCVAAVPLFREALALDPRHEDSLYYLGNCLVELERPDEALEHLAGLMRINPMSHRAFKRWGTLTAATATTPAALEAASRALERATEINPEETGARQALAEVALLLGDAASARRRLEQVVQSNPGAGAAHFLLAYLDWREGDEASARERLARAHATQQWRALPEGVVGEGEVRRVAHRDETPLLHTIEAWDGSLDPSRAFGPLERRLATVELAGTEDHRRG